MKKKGFTLVELLAVIAILAILVIIALPNVLGMFQSAKKNTFTTELQNIYKSATTQYVSDSMNRGAGQRATQLVYARTKSGDTTVSCGTKKELDLSGTETIEYYIEFDLAGNVIKYIATDGEFVFWFDGSLTNNDTTNALGDYKDMTQLSIEDIGASVKVYTVAEAKAPHDYTINFSPITANAEGVCNSSIDVQAVSKDGTNTQISSLSNLEYIPRIKANTSLNSYGAPSAQQ